MNQDQRENIGNGPIREESKASEDAAIAHVLSTHGKNPLAEEEAIKADSSHGD